MSRCSRAVLLFMLKTLKFNFPAHALICVCGFALLPHKYALADAAEKKFTFEAVEMGTLFRITLFAGDEKAAEAASTAARKRVAELNATLSDYLPESEINRLSLTSGQGRAVRASDDLWSVLAVSQDIARKTDGAFDVTVGPLVKTWKHARRLEKMPAPELIARMLARVGLQEDAARSRASHGRAARA